MDRQYRVIVTGDRHWYCEALAYRVVKGLKAKHGPGVVILEGGAGGVDWAFHVAANGCEVATQRFNADWDRFGHGAGPMRNRAMVEAGADICIAVHRNLAGSKGTKDCVRQSLKAGIPVWLIESEDGKPIRLGPEYVAPTPADEEAEGPTSTEAFDQLRAKAAEMFSPEELPEVAKDHEAELLEAPGDNLWGLIATEVDRANSAWAADHPDAPEVVRWEEAVMHLAHYTKGARMHKLDLMKCGPHEVIGTLIEVGKNKFKRSHIEKELKSFMAKAVQVAKKRAKPRRTRGPR
jgi:hypothetical protein